MNWINLGDARFALTPECDRLVKAAQALLDENAEVALYSFRDHNGKPWSDAMWLRGDAHNARLCIELRRALAAAVPKESRKPRKWEGPGSRAEIADYEAGK